MKTGVSSYSFLKYAKQTNCDYKTICDLAKKIGYDGIEFINLENMCGVSNENVLKTARFLKSYCADIGLDIIAYTVAANFLADDLQSEESRIRFCVDTAAALGATIMRHDAAWGPRPVFRYDYRDAIEEIAPRIREIADYAQAKGIKTCTENHGRFLQAPERVKELMDAVNHANYGWLVDVGNFMGVDADVLAAVQIAAPYAFHVHVKDNLYKSGSEVPPEGFRRTQGGNYLRATVLGHGVVPVTQCVGIIRETGYDGYLSVEFEGWEDNLQALETSYAYLRKIV